MKCQAYDEMKNIWMEQTHIPEGSNAKFVTSANLLDASAHNNNGIFEVRVIWSMGETPLKCLLEKCYDSNEYDDGKITQIKINT